MVAQFGCAEEPRLWGGPAAFNAGGRGGYHQSDEAFEGIGYSLTAGEVRVVVVPLAARCFVNDSPWAAPIGWLQRNSGGHVPLADELIFIAINTSLLG